MAKKKSMIPKRIRLTELVDALRNDLIAYNSAKDSKYKPMFKVKGATIEASVEAQIEVGAKGEIGFWVAKLGASGTKKSSSNCKIAITLIPVEKKDDQESTLVMGTRRKRRSPK